MRRLPPLVLLLWWFALPNSARAEERLPLELDWEAPAECSNADSVHAELARIAHVRAGREVQPLAAKVRIRKLGPRYRLLLHITQGGSSSERTLAASECRALQREVTLVLALAFGEGVELTTDEPAEVRERHGEDEPQGTRIDEPTPPVAAPPPEPAPVQVRTPKPTPPRRSPAPANRFRWDWLAGGGALWRALPVTSPVAFLGADVGFDSWWLQPRVQLIPGVNRELPRGIQTRYDGLGATLAGCSGAALASLRLATCLSLSATALRGRASGAVEEENAIAPWYTAGAHVSLLWPARGWLGGGVEGAFSYSLSRPRFRINGLADVHTVPRVAPALSVYLRVRLEP
ncbi:MAG TPA: hypothetical protein VFQ61_11685 [Polyangiaceae bacterium]|nr:hypothetical protein [Polyangiaceae bacterium]